MQQQEIKSEWLKMSELVKLLSIGRNTLYIMIEKGEFPEPTRFSSRFVRWSSSDVYDWINAKEQARQ
ncbi:helix-turn-helix transcriptional regulator [Mannheimia haemolytica]|uniref:helix-turn-helix transcriptional regulator n=1 Tax=Mannheimia haemolytica TaxID=75985 RepID=UPI00137906D0|nr:AlpA family phage regulatory protein [Mannheimia haemolytica]NBB67534.1 AlpA family phage regulatory protein [Mannheimia haemolytica]